jgi:hypothetical protein
MAARAFPAPEASRFSVGLMSSKKNLSCKWFSVAALMGLFMLP